MLLSHFIEITGSKGLIAETPLLYLQIINLSLMVSLPTALVWTIDPHPGNYFMKFPRVFKMAKNSLIM